MSARNRTSRGRMISSALRTYLIGAFLLYKRLSAYDLIAFEGKFNTHLRQKFISAGRDVHKFKVASALQCSQRCLVQGGICKGINFLEKPDTHGLHDCEVLSKSKSSSEDVLQPIDLPNWIYFNNVEFKERTGVNIIVYCTKRFSHAKFKLQQTNLN